jgi:hypothetical protein
LSNRSCAETCSAMVSRSRLNKTRGPPDALRMLCGPPPQNQPGVSPSLGVKLKKNNNFIHSAPRRALNVRANQVGQTVAQFAAAHPEGRIANWDLFCQAKRLPRT